MSHILELKNINYGHGNDQQVFSDFNLTIKQGERVGVVGPNGAGKTSMFLLATGVYVPKKGEILFYGKKIKPNTFNPDIGMIFQNQDDQLFSPSVWEDIAFGLKNMGLAASTIETKVNDMLNELQISHLKNKPPHHLSGGEKRLIAIAGVMVMSPKLVIWDEPTSNLDMRYRRRLIKTIEEAPQEAMLIASHDLEFVLEVCNRVVLIDKGIIIMDALPKEVLSNRELIYKHGLELPYSLR